MRGKIASAIAAGLLAACAHAPGPGDVPRGTEFSTNILGDGTKLFKVKVHAFVPDERRSANGANAHERMPGDCFPCEPGEQRGGAARSRDKPLDLKEVATAMIAQNHYCRDGFVVLEQYQQGRGRILRGECRDTANDDDRARFSR